MSRAKEVCLRLVSLLLGVAASLVLGEITLRVRAAVLDRDPAEELRRTIASSPPPIFDTCALSKQAHLGQIVRPSLDHEVVYELKPGIDTCFYGVPVHTNDQGLRAARHYAQPKPRDVTRVLLLGDSQTFGQGVDQADTFAALLERELDAPGLRGRVEVINAGVPGYNAAQEAAFLRRFGMSFEPDCVVVLFIDNDFGLPYLMLERRDVLALTDSYLLGAVRSLARRPQYDLVPWDVAAGSLQNFVREDEMKRVPAAYRPMVGLSGYRRALAQLSGTAAKRGTPIVNLADYSALPREVADDLVRYQTSLGILHPDFVYPLKPRFRLSSEDAHFNALGHRNVAGQIVAALKQAACRIPGQ